VDLSIIIVNWKSAAYVRKCLNSLAANPTHLSTEIIVVDGGSFDECGEMIAKEFPLVKFFQSPENVGFGRSNNLGFSHSTGKTILLLNPDTEVRGDAIRILYDALTKLPNAGALGAKLLNTDLTLQTSCVMAYPTALNQILDSEFLRAKMRDSRLWAVASLYNGSLEPSPIEAISGACVMMPRSVFESVGGFDPAYFMYGEDVDLSFKIHKAGYKLYYVPRAEIVHHGGGSSASARSTFSTVMMRESVRLFLRKRRGAFSAAMYSVFLGVSAVLRLALCSAKALASGRKPSRAIAPINKWLAILRWSLGFESWAATAGVPRAQTKT
jgi:GT2 family glycosyltransferase